MVCHRLTYRTLTSPNASQDETKGQPQDETKGPAPQTEVFEMIGPDGTSVKATVARLRFLYVYWRGGTSNEDFQRDAAELLHNAFKMTQEGGAPPLATLPPTVLNP